MEDGFSRFISLAPLKSKLSEDVIQGLLKHFISRFGCPLTIHSDNGREFMNLLLGKLLARLEVAHTFTPAYNPQSNNVERFHPAQLPCLELAYNSKVNEATGRPHFWYFWGEKPNYLQIWTCPTIGRC
ncbi:MAG: transposase family protein [Gammaproteobacteria bacterium]|nr:transposase family protein [Gammaproteobacteria bacterium]